MTVPIRKLLTAWALLLISAPALAAPVDPKNPPHGRFTDEWMEIYVGDAKAGYAHSSMNRVDARIESRLQFNLKLGRVDQPVSVKLDQRVIETLEGTPVSFSTETDLSVMKTSTRGEVQGGKVSITTSQLGMEQKQEYDFPKGAVMTWGALRESLLQGFKPGTKYTVEVYAPELRLDAGVAAVTTVGDWEEFTHDGRAMKGQKITVEMQTPVGSMEMLSWVDADGLPIKSVMPVPGIGNMVMITTDQKTAMADFVPPEFFMNTVIKADQRIDYKNAARITYRVSSKDPGVPIRELPQAGSQRIVARTETSLDVLVERQKHRKAETPKRRNIESGGGGSGAPAIDNQQSTMEPAELAEYLSGNLMINVEDPKLVELASRAAAGEKEPFALADNLRRFVTDYVSSKNLNIGFATASEVARNREGDCSEHGVLLAALGRINGIPSRVAVGLAYVPFFGNQDDIFGYHLWTQFYIDGRWIDVDAALRETECSPIRIAFATSSLRNSGLADLSLPLIDKLGAIDLKVLKIE